MKKYMYNIWEWEIQKKKIYVNLESGFQLLDL